MIYRLLFILMISNTVFAQDYDPSINYFEGKHTALLSNAKKTEQPYIVYYTNPACKPCHLFEQKTLQDTRIIDHLNANYLIYKKIVHKNEAKISFLPTLLIYEADGKLVDKVEKAITPEKLLKTLHLLQGIRGDTLKKPRSLQFFDGNWGLLHSTAKKRELPFVLFFVEPWSGPSRHLTEITLNDSAIVYRLQNHFLPKLVDSDMKKQEKFLQKFKIKTFPTFVFFDSKGKMIGKEHGYRKPQEFAKVLDKYHLMSSKANYKINYYKGNLESLKATAKRYKKPFIVFYSDEKDISHAFQKSMTDPLVLGQISKKFIIYKVITKTVSPKDAANFHPSIVFYDKDANMKGVERDYYDPDAFLQMLKKYTN